MRNAETDRIRQLLDRAGVEILLARLTIEDPYATIDRFAVVKLVAAVENSAAELRRQIEVIE